MGGRNSRHTGCKVMKRLMSKDLASSFSLTGLGHKRKRVKNSFKDHPIANIVVGESILVRLWSTYRVGCTCAMIKIMRIRIMMK